MKFEKNNRYFTIAVYVFVTWLVIFIASTLIFHIGTVLERLGNILKLGYILLEPLIIGLVIAYLLDPLVDFYENKCKALSFSKLFHRKTNSLKSKEKRWVMRTIPTLFAFATLFMILGLFVLLIIMNIREVAGSFSLVEIRKSVIGYMDYFEAMIENFTGTVQSFGLSAYKGNLLSSIYNTINKYIVGCYKAFLGSLSIWGLHTMNWLLALVIAFYLLQDSRRLWAVMKSLFSKLLGRRALSTFILLKKIDYAFTGYIRGEILDSIIITILTAGVLTLIQLDFAVIIGIISGVFNLIPYFGPIVGFVLAIVVGLLDPNPIKALYGAIAVLIIQQIDGWFIVPKIVGDCVKLHPVIVLLVILIGGNLYGLLGMLLAVPTAAIIRILLMHYFPNYFEVEEDIKDE